MAITNQNQAVRYYAPQYLGMFQTIFEVNTAFSRAMAPLQTLDGVKNNTKMFSVKTNNQPVVVHDKYDTSVDGGSGATSRFGAETEVIYEDQDVEYDYTLAINEKLDNFTVNEDMSSAIADRLKLQLEAQVKRANAKAGAYITSVVPADNKLSLASLDAAGVAAAFDDVSVKLAEIDVDAEIVTAYVSPVVYNIIVKDPATTIEKHSAADIDAGTVVEYMGIKIEKTASKYLGDGVAIDIVPDGTILPFIGHQVTRTLSVNENFDGVRLQSTSKGGTFMLDDNKKAVFQFASSAE